MAIFYKQLTKNTLDIIESIPVNKSLTFVAPTGSSGKFILSLQTLLHINPANKKTQVLMLYDGRKRNRVEKGIDHFKRLTKDLNLNIHSEVFTGVYPISRDDAVLRRQPVQVAHGTLGRIHSLLHHGLLNSNDIKCICFVDGDSFVEQDIINELKEFSTLFRKKPLCFIRSIQPTPTLKSVFHKPADYYNIIGH